MKQSQPSLRAHLLEAAKQNLWDETVRCLFDHIDYIDRDLYQRAVLLGSQRNNTKMQAQQGLITRERERVELAQNDKAFMDLFEDINPDILVNAGEEVQFDDLKIEISLPELKIKLNNYLLSFGLLATLDLLLEITKDKGPLHTLKHDFKSKQWEFSFEAQDDLLQWYTTEERFKEELMVLIQALELANLRTGWEKLVNEWTALPHQITTTNYHLLFPEAEDIYPLIKTDASQADADKYRRLLHLAQDAFKLGDYELSLKYCRQVQQYIEPASAQLYEFLLQAFFNQQSANTIIEDALKGDCKLLQQLFVYVGRVNSLLRKQTTGSQSSQPGIQYRHTEIPRKKLDHIVDGLSRSLQWYGSQIDFDYVLTNERDSTYLERRQAMEQYLQIGVKICRFVNPKPTLVETLLNELAGGGKFDWIGTDEAHQLIDHFDFPAVGTFNSLLKQVEHQSGHSLQNMYALNLRNSLKQKLNQLYKAYPEVKHGLQADQESTLFHMVSKWLHACKTAYLLFEQDKSFLSLAIQEELTKPDGLLDWFTFDPEGQLVERQLQGRHVQSNVKTEYEFIVKSLLGDAGWERLEAEIIQKHYDRWIAR
ncbi:MAG: hypothetical protein D6772_09745, partial [Bacteroidetes bacterium]